MKRSHIVAASVAVLLALGVAAPSLAGGGHNWSPFRGDQSIDAVSIHGYAGPTFASGCLARVEPLALVPGANNGYRMQGRLRMQCDDVGLRFSKIKWTQVYSAGNHEVYRKTHAIIRDTPFVPKNSTWTLNQVDLSCQQVNPRTRGSYMPLSGESYVSVWDTNGVKYKTNQLVVPVG
ncbi:MAG TPA: hypothetical protein VMT88_03735, partial [Actinomycetes bacterium]|nr:hypothetical protein [Actinomycetes bacterium]